MKPALWTVLLIFAYPESQADSVNRGPIAQKTCALTKKSVLVTVHHCSGYVTVGFCQGLCAGISEYSLTGLSVQRKCTCCKETKMSQPSVELQCPDQTSILYSYITIAGCDCLATKCSP